jgi:hypothetical protein
MTSDAPLIFISYANPDRSRVTPYFEDLENRGFNVWIDYKRLVAGQNWDFEIRKALDAAAVVVVFFSNNSVDRRGYVQREIKLALDQAEEKLAGDIYIIPVLLDQAAQIPDQVKSIQCVKAWEDDSHDAIKNAINHQLSAIGIEVRAAQERANLTWTQIIYKEAWKGLPGYEVELKVLRFSSTEYLNIEDINVILYGDLVLLLTDARKAKFSQETEGMSFGQNEYWRTNTLSAYPIEPIITGRILSIHYNIYTCNAGAAHPYIEALGEAMSRHVDREMTRARVHANVRRSVGAATELAPLVHSLIATLARTPAGIQLTFEPRIPDHATARRRSGASNAAVPRLPTPSNRPLASHSDSLRSRPHRSW